MLAVGFIGALAASNEFDSLDRRLADVERAAGRAAPATWSWPTRPHWPGCPGAVQTYRAALALVGGDLGGTVRHAELALDRAAADDHLTTASASALVGLASWATGDLAAAHASYRVAAAEPAPRSGTSSDVLGCTVSLADIELTRGRLGDAERTLPRRRSRWSPASVAVCGARPTCTCG